MKKIGSITIVFFMFCAFVAVAEPSVRAGRSGVSVHLVLGKNTQDSIAQLGAGYEYGIIKHLSAGVGYAYVDGRDPIQNSGLDLFVKGYLFDSVFDLYGKFGTQLYNRDGLGMITTFLGGVEWQSPFMFFLAFESGAELERSDWGYLYGAVLGMRF